MLHFFRSILPLMLVGIMALLLFGGCSKPSIDLAVVSQPNVNPDDSGRPSPVIVRIYELRNNLAFEQADFNSLFDNYMRVLTGDLVSAKELTCVPGQTYTVSYTPVPDTRYLGILAGFRQMERAYWRVLLPIDPEDSNPVKFELNDVALNVVPKNEAGKWTPEKALEDYQNRMDRINMGMEEPVGAAQVVEEPAVKGISLERLNSEVEFPADSFSKMPANSMAPSNVEVGVRTVEPAVEGAVRDGAVVEGINSELSRPTDASSLLDSAESAAESAARAASKIDGNLPGLSR